MRWKRFHVSALVAAELKQMSTCSAACLVCGVVDGQDPLIIHSQSKPSTVIWMTYSSGDGGIQTVC